MRAMNPGAPSLWLTESESSRLEPLAAGKHNVDALVIGLGLTGASAAVELAEAGLSVLAIDAHGLGWGASARSGGFLLVEHAIEYPARRERFGAQRMQTVVQMARANHRTIEERYARDGEHRRCGSLILAMNDDPAEQATLANAAALLREDGVPCELGLHEPLLDGFATGLSIPEDGEVHPGRLLCAIGKDAQTRGAMLREGCVDHIDPIARVAITSNATINYGVAVVAVNAWTKRLIPQVAIEPQRAQMLATSPVGPVRALKPVCYAAWGYDYFRQRDDGRVLIGGRRHMHRDAEATDDSRPTDAVQADLESYLATHLRSLGPFEIEARWSGIMGFSPDELPFWSPLDDARGSACTHVLGGMTGHGMGLGGVCGQTIAARCHREPTKKEASYADLLHVQRLTQK